MVGRVRGGCGLRCTSNTAAFPGVSPFWRMNLTATTMLYPAGDSSCYLCAFLLVQHSSHDELVSVNIIQHNSDATLLSVFPAYSLVLRLLYLHAGWSRTLHSHIWHIWAE